MRKAVEPLYNFFPRTWLLPLNLEELKRYIPSSNHPLSNPSPPPPPIRHKEEIKPKKPYYVIKPESSCQVVPPPSSSHHLTANNMQGKGIYLSKRVETFSGVEQSIVQEYIKNPFLLDGLKFDFRIYVLIKNLDPLKIFMYPEGLARFATVPYAKPNKRNCKNFMMHLTNYAVNKKNPDFVFN